MAQMVKRDCESFGKYRIIKLLYPPIGVIILQFCKLFDSTFLISALHIFRMDSTFCLYSTLKLYYATATLTSCDVLHVDVLQTIIRPIPTQPNRTRGRTRHICPTLVET